MVSRHKKVPSIEASARIPGTQISLFFFVTVTFATINITNIRFGAKLGIVFAFGKLIALLAIIVTGLVYMGFGHTENFSDPWKNTITDPGKVATATLNAYFAYKGW